MLKRCVKNKWIAVLAKRWRQLKLTCCKTENVSKEVVQGQQKGSKFITDFT